MRTIVLALATAALLTACAGQFWQTRRPAEIWLLMGQSNMSGRGDIAQLPRELAAPDYRIRVWGNDEVLTMAREPLDSAAGQHDEVSTDALAGVGPGLSFARARIAGRSERRLILVPCAKGGSAISEWAAAESRQTLFGSCVARARSASRHGRLTGILWYQGETDARDPVTAAGWVSSFMVFLNDLRRSLGQNDLPVIVVGLADPPVVGPYAGRYPAWSAVQAAQTRLQGIGLTVVPAAGLSKNADDLHLTTEAQQTLGLRLAVAAEGLAP